MLLFSSGEKKTRSNVNVLFVIAPHNYRDEEFLVPYETFNKSHFNITVASIDTGICKGMLGHKFRVKNIVDTINFSKYAAVVLPGGSGVPVLWSDTIFLTKLREFYKDTTKIVGAICLSPATLAISGILHGKNATVWPSKKTIAILKQNGAAYRNSPVVTDGRIVTAKGPQYAGKFADALIKLLEVKNK